MTFIETLERYWWLVSFLIINLGGLIIAFYRLQGAVDTITKRLDKAENEVEKLGNKVNHNDITLAEIKVQLLNITTIVQKIDTKINK